MTDKSILVEIHQLPENLKLEVMHFIAFLKQKYAGKSAEAKPVWEIKRQLCPLR
jgi:hypothetical protein